jgi:shikimate dehydrogenase
MSMPVDLTAIQACITNRIDAAALGERRLAGVIGDSPSRYSRSPALWNAAFRLLEIDALYVALDVAADHLRDLLSALRNSERLLGVNVTVPHKANAIEYLDAIDPAAARIQAVNTIARTPDGRLIGYNTDGSGFIESILQPEPGHSKPFIESVRSLKVLLLGAGGSARAVAFHLADVVTDGELIICNRTRANADALAEEIRRQGGNTRAVPESELPQAALEADLIVNCTTKGQQGLRTRERGRLIAMEHYSALAPVGAAAGTADIERNHRLSLELAAAMPKDAAFYDLIYAPAETAFLRHARMTGHRTMNGKAMIIRQAALGLIHHLCRQDIEIKGRATADVYNRTVEAMYQAWK